MRQTTGRAPMHHEHVTTPGLATPSGRTARVAW